MTTHWRSPLCLSRLPSLADQPRTRIADEAGAACRLGATDRGPGAATGAPRKGADAEALLDSVTQDPRADANLLSAAAMTYAGAGKPAKGAALMQKLAAANPNDWMLWYYLAQLQAQDAKAAEAADALGKAFALNFADRVTNQNQQVTNFHDFVRQDQNFNKIRQTPEFQKAIEVKK